MDFFQSMGGGGGWALVPLIYANDSGAARICQRVAKRGSEATERGEGVGSPSHGGEIFFSSVYKNGNFLHNKRHYGGGGG